MRNVIKIVAVLAVVGAVASIALAGGSLASSGNTGYSQGMMDNHGGSGMSGQGCSHMSTSYASGNGHCWSSQCSGNGNTIAAYQNQTSGQMVQHDCGDCCHQDPQTGVWTCDHQGTCCGCLISSTATSTQNHNMGCC